MTTETQDTFPPILRREPGVTIRERRLGSITGYLGTPDELVQISQAGKLRERERPFTQAGTCSSFCATLQLSLIQDAVVINHAPAGCAGDFPMFNLYNRYGQGKRNLNRISARLITTNLNDQDTIFGAAGKMQEAIHKAYRTFHPRAIFVTASCASGIIGEDLESAIEEAEEELGIPIASVNCEGFRSQVWATGWDAAYNAILQKIVRPAATRRPDLINIITFIGDDYFSELLKPLGLVPNLIVPFTKIEQLERISEAGATAQMCSTLGTFLAAGLEKHHGVPEIKAPPPYGLSGTDAWLRELARVTGKDDIVEQFIAAEHSAVDFELSELRRQFAGTKAFVAAGPSHGHSSMQVLQDIGIELVGSCMFHHDARLDHGDPAGDSLQAATRFSGRIPYSVCNKQAYELVNVLARLRPDLVIVRHPSLAVSVAKLGIPACFVDDEHLALGYRGLIRYGRKIADWLRNPAIERNLFRYSPLPYTRWWLEQHPFSIQEQEISFHYYFERAADFLLEFRWDMPSHFVTISDSFYGIGISRLLTNEFGLLPLHQFVTDEPPEEFRPSIQAYYAKIAPGISSDITFTADGDQVNNVLRAVASAPPIVLGSIWDRDIAQELGGCHLSIAAPITDRLVANCSYLGYSGGLRLIEDLYSSILASVH